jgi:hypothetical protein
VIVEGELKMVPALIFGVIVEGELKMVPAYCIDFLCTASDDVGRLAWLTGFTGSNGMAVVTQTSAVLWTDGRYSLQAAGVYK